MKFYVIPPVSAMDLALMGDRIYVLAHLYVKHLSYRNWVLERKKAGWFVTLDNSAAERALVTEDILIEITRELMPDEVIAPDILFDDVATVQATQSFIERMRNENLLDFVYIFGCPQGDTKEKWMACYKWMEDNTWIDTIGLSKIAVPKAFLDQDSDQGIKQARRIAVAELEDKGLLTKPIHCLGMGDPMEYRFYQGLPQIRSTDSCYSVLAAMHGIEFGVRKEFQRIPTPHDYFDAQLTPEQRRLAERNILWMREELH